MSATSVPSADVANGSRGFANSERHDDPVDGVDDVSWAKQGELASGASALRVLMTDAPIDADNVFVTFCGVHVHALGDAGRAGGAARDAAGAPRGEDGRPVERGSAGARGEAGAGGEARPTGEARAPGDSDGAGGAAGSGERPAAPDAEPTDDGIPAAAGVDGDDAEAERAEAERAEGDGAEAERAEGDGAEAERAEGEPGDVGADGRDPSGDPTFAPPGGAEGAGAGEWLTVSDQCQTLDLLSLRDGVTEALGVATLPPGRYGQIRLMLVDASIVVDGAEQELTIPSGAESGLKIGNGFALFDGVATTITLDFDAGRSIHLAAGNGYMMRPVIDVVDVTTHDGQGSVSEGRGERPSNDPARGADGASGGERAPRGDAAGRPEPRPEPPPQPGLPPQDQREPQAEPPAAEAPAQEPPPSAEAPADDASAEEAPADDSAE